MLRLHIHSRISQRLLPAHFLYSNTNPHDFRQLTNSSNFILRPSVHPSQSFQSPRPFPNKQCNNSSQQLQSHPRQSKSASRQHNHHSPSLPEQNQWRLFRSRQFFSLQRSYHLLCSQHHSHHSLTRRRYHPHDGRIHRLGYHHHECHQSSHRTTTHL